MQVEENRILVKISMIIILLTQKKINDAMNEKRKKKGLQYLKMAA